MRTALAVLIIVAVVGLALAGMARGWRRRAERDTALPPLPEPPGGAGAAEVAGRPAGDPVRYQGTTRSGEWLERVVAHGLGRRGRGSVELLPTGVLIHRDGERPLHLPADALRDVRVDRAGAGRATRRPEVLVLTWEHGGRTLDTVLRPRHQDRLVPLRDELRTLTRPGGHDHDHHDPAIDGGQL